MAARSAALLLFNKSFNRKCNQSVDPIEFSALSAGSSAGIFTEYRWQSNRTQYTMQSEAKRKLISMEWLFHYGLPRLSRSDLTHWSGPRPCLLWFSYPVIFTSPTRKKEREKLRQEGKEGRKERKKERKSLGKTLAELVGAPLRNPMRRIERVQFYAAKKNNCTCLIARGGRRRRKRKRRRRRRRRRWWWWWWSRERVEKYGRGL